MKTLDKFLSIAHECVVICEELTPSQKKSVDKWEKGDNSFSDHMYKESKDPNRATFELESPNKSEHEDIVKNHLEPHGFKIKDYKLGKVEDKHGRETSIGKALGKVKAPDDVKRKFENDPTRAQKEKTNLHVSISRHPHDVAGMTSKGHSWENESCMNFSNGSNKEYLKKDVKHGTHVAYLTHKDDHNNSNPIGRIALKKYTNIDDPHDHILRPEHRTYGNAPDTFTHTVNKAVNKHFPGKEDAIYKKHDSVYDDTGNKYVMGHKAIDKAITHHDPEVRSAASKQVNLTSKHIHKILDLDASKDDHGSYVVNKMKMDALNNPNATSEHISKALDDKDVNIKRAAIMNHKATPEHIHKALDDEDRVVRLNAINNPNATSEHIHKALKSKFDPLRKAAIMKHNVTSEHIHKALDDAHPEVRIAAVKHKKATPEHINKALNDDHPDVRQAAKAAKALAQLRNLSNH